VGACHRAFGPHRRHRRHCRRPGPQWRATQQPAFSDAPDLLRDIRPQLDRLTPAILDALAKALPALHAPATRARLNNYADNAARRAAMAPLLEVAPQN
jgi:chorismate mutase